MRIALLADLHGNDLALNAVLSDIEKKGAADTIWVLGDLCAIGPAPVKVLEILGKLPNTRIIRGNTDRYICTGDRPGSIWEAASVDPSQIPKMLEIEGDFSWTLGAVTETGWLDWLSELPLEFRETLPDGTRVLGVHASPGEDDGSGIFLGISDVALEALLLDTPEDLICVGHTHQPFSRQIGNKQVVNPGSISNHIGSDTRASYAIINAGVASYEVEFHRVAYDNQAIIDYAEKIRHPASRFIRIHMRGERIPG